MMKLKVLAVTIVVIAAVGVGGFFYVKNNDQSNSSSKKEETTTEASSTEDNEEDTSEETKKEDSKKDSDAKETTEKDKNQAVISTEEGFDSDDSETETRESDETKELFQLTLKFINAYDLDSDHFKVTKALMVQNDSVDYMYFVCKHDGKSEYACYTYDGGYFRDDISQAKLKEEYEDCLVTKKFDQSDGEVYHNFSTAEIKEVNNMY